MEQWMQYRKSCRKFQDGPVSDVVLAHIEALKSEFQFPHHQQFSWQVTTLVDPKPVTDTYTGLISRYVSVRAPHYLMLSCVAQEKDSFLIGFLGECFIKHLTLLGIGTCWVGHHLKRDQALALGMPPEHTYKILIAFGMPQEPLDLVVATKRKTLFEIGYPDDENEKWLYEALQSAPSAVNTQPWYLKHLEGRYHYYLNKKHLLSPVLKGMNAIDMGIGFYHLYDAIKGRGFRMSWDFDHLEESSGSKVLHFKYFE